MAISPTPRLGLPYWSAGTDEYPGRDGWNQILDIIDDNTAIVLTSGPRSNRPQSGAAGRFYLATDESPSTGGRLYYDGGTGWVELNTNGDGGAGRPLTVGTTGTEGTSPRSARADHTHPVPLATSTVDGLMPKGLVDMLQKANANYTTATVQTLAKRNHRGAIQVNDPMDQYDAATKRWVENTVGDFMPVPNTLVRRYDNGHFRVPPSGQGLDDAVGKRYVDSKASKQAWKENVRPLDYGLEQLRAVNTLVFDYKRSAPEVGTDVAGAFVEQIAELMPRMATYNASGAPERIKDREMFWVAVKAIQDLAADNDRLHEELTEVHEELAGLRASLAAIQHHLGLEEPAPEEEAPAEA